MSTPSLKHPLILFSVLLLWGVAGGIAGPHVDDLDAPTVKHQSPNATGVEKNAPGDVLHLLCQLAPLDDGNVRAPVPNQSVKALLVSAPVGRDPIEVSPRTTTRALTWFINQN